MDLQKFIIFTLFWIIIAVLSYRAGFLDGNFAGMDYVCSGDLYVVDGEVVCSEVDLVDEVNSVYSMEVDLIGYSDKT